MSRIGTTISLSCCPCPCPGSCNEATEGGDPPIELPAPFYEFYAAEDASAYGPPFVAPSAFTAEEQLSTPGSYTGTEMLDYRVYSYDGTFKSQNYESDQLTMTTEGVSVDLEWTMADGITQTIVFRQIDSGGWAYMVVGSSVNSASDDGTMTGWTLGGPETFPDVESTLTGCFDNDRVFQLLDQSGNSRHRTQSTEAAQPIFSTATPLNGKDCILFTDGKSLETGAYTEQNAFTVWLVVNMTSATETPLNPLRLHPSYAAGVAAIFSTGGEWFMMYGPGPALLGGGAADLDTPTLIVAVFNGVNSKLRINGAEVNTGGLAVDLETTISHLIGGVYKYYGDGAYAEALSDEQCELLESEVATYFGLGLTADSLIFSADTEDVTADS
jgi:hypothetical protein